MPMIDPRTGRPYGSSETDFPGYGNGGINPGGMYGNGGYNVFGNGGGPNINTSTERNPDIAQSQSELRKMAGQVDPMQRARDAMATARELGIGMTAEARANEARRGVSGSGVSSYNDRNIQAKVMSEAAKAGEQAKYGGEELKLNALGQGLSAAEAQANSQFQRQQMQNQMAMQQWQERMQQQRDIQNKLLDKMLSDVGTGGLSNVAPPASAGQNMGTPGGYGSVGGVGRHGPFG
jgi:hypothetical protein